MSLSAITNADAIWLLDTYGVRLRRLAYRYHGVRTPLEIEDLVSAGHVGLCEAWLKYDPSFNVPDFWLYAFKRARGAMIEEIRRAVPFPRSVKKEDYMMLAITPAIEDELQAPPIELEERSLDNWEHALDALNPRYKQVVALYFVRGHSLRAIGELYDIGESRASQIVGVALSKLQEQRL